jgi:L-arabinonolactonase
MSTTPSLALDLRCTLGEGLLWDEPGQRWWWTDIEAACLYTWSGDLGQAPVRHALPDRLACLAPARSGRVLLGLAKGLAWGSPGPAGLEVAPLVAVDAGEPRTRVNDGRTDRGGNFVFGTFNEAADQRPIGSFYQYSQRHGLRQLALPAVSIANSICFSPDGGTMYFTDSLQGVIQQCRYDAENAEVGSPRPFATVPAPGLPDGSIIDADGCLWNAQWGAGRVQRYSPQGKPLQQLRLPVPQLTCPAFGGPDLRTLMLTSARKGLSPEQLEQAPLSGGLFQFRVPGCAGLVDAAFDDLPGWHLPPAKIG